MGIRRWREIHIPMGALNYPEVKAALLKDKGYTASPETLDEEFQNCVMGYAQVADGIVVIDNEDDSLADFSETEKVLESLKIAYDRHSDACGDHPGQVKVFRPTVRKEFFLVQKDEDDGRSVPLEHAEMALGGINRAVKMVQSGEPGAIERLVRAVGVLENIVNREQPDVAYPLKDYLLKGDE